MGTERKMTERDRYTSDYDTIDAGGATGPCLLPPTNVGAGTYWTPCIDMKGYEKAVFDVLGGAANDVSAALEVEIYQSAVGSATAAQAADAKVLAGLAGPKLITDSGMGNYSYSGFYYYSMNRKWLLEVDVEEMDVDNLFRYLQVRYVVLQGRTWLLAIQSIRSLASYEACPQTNADQVIA